MNLSRNLASLAPVYGAVPAPPTAPVPRIPRGRITSSVRRGLAAFGWRDTEFHRRDLQAAMRWLAS